MAGLQRSTVSFRRQGSSGLVWDDEYLSGQLVKHKEQTNKADRAIELEGKHKEEMMVLKVSSRTVESTRRSRSNGGLPTGSGRVSPAVEPPSPKLSACGLCCAINGKKVKSRRRLQL